MNNYIHECALRLYNILEEFRNNPENLSYDGSIILNDLRHIVEKNLPLKIVLPAFHGKSNNRNFVISHLPDYGDYLGVQTLVNLYSKLSLEYPNVEIFILHEGHFQADVNLFGDDNDVKAYINQFRKIIAPYPYIKSYCIRELLPHQNTYESQRNFFLKEYCPNNNELDSMIKIGGRIHELYLAYAKIYRYKIVDSKKEALSCKDAKEYSRNRSILQLKKYIGFAKLLKKTFENEKFIKLSWVYKDNSFNDQISINVIKNVKRFGTPGFFSIVEYNGGTIDLMTREKAKNFGMHLKTFDGLPFYSEK